MLRTLIILLCSIQFMIEIGAFNLSPKPNLVFKEPELFKYQMQYQSSNFGFSLNLRTSSIFIGAPKAQSSLESQRAVNETGVVYKCRLDTAECMPYNVDALGNKWDGFDSEKKDHQLLGYAMDGNTLDEDRLVICAPKLMVDINDRDGFLHGICYVIDNPVDQQPESVTKMKPLTDQRMQMDSSAFYYIYGEMGFSVHVPENADEILMGAPGIYSWKGTVIRNRLVKDDFGSMSKRDVRSRKFEYYVNDVPNPAKSEISDDSYFGYAISSGYFDDRVPDKLLYVASAPQSNLQRGEVRIFDIVEVSTLETKIKTITQFQSQHIGEYFGYAVLAEDFNNDGLPDLAIAAPYFRRDIESLDNGVVYIYHNGKNLHFSERKTLFGDSSKSGRFGSTLGKVGDLNRDGYNDLAVGAPFEDQGAVYIYLGSAEGLSTEVVQKLTPAENDMTTAPQWFGFGISKGVDIDGNGFNDVAIGSPNAETVYLFRSYPVVNIKSQLSLSQNILTAEDETVKATICYHYEAKSDIPLQEIDLGFDLKLDELDGRAFIEKREYEVSITKTRNCWNLDIQIRPDLSKIFKPIEIQFVHRLVSPPPDATEFCTTCVLLDPKESRTTAIKIAFSTGCASTVCVADLKLSSKLLDFQIPYVIGSSRTINIEYTMTNSGEKAYLTVANFVVPNYFAFNKVPQKCDIDKANNKMLICGVGSNGILFTGKEEKFVLSLDSTSANMAYDDSQIIANITSYSDEANVFDNEHILRIQLKEFSEVEVFGKSSKRQVSLADSEDSLQIKHNFEIFNKGPTNLNNLLGTIKIPISYTSTSGREHKIIDSDNITISGKNENHILDFVISKTFASASGGGIAISAMGMGLSDNSVDTAQQNMDFEAHHIQHNNDFSHSDSMSTRKRRALEMREYNKYTQRVISFPHSRRRRSVSEENDDLYKDLPENRTVFFNCDNVRVSCLHVKFNVSNLFPGKSSAAITVNFNLDMTVYENIFDDYLNMFAIQLKMDLTKAKDTDDQSLHVVNINPYTIIYQNTFETKKTPIWVYIVSSLGGVLLLALLIFGLFKCGFFKRKLRDDLAEEYRKSIPMTTMGEASPMLDESKPTD